MLSAIRTLLLFLLLAGQAPAAARWQQWDGCTLARDRYFDGDSFHVRYRGRDFVLRLYFVDAAETDASYPARVREQAAYFGVSPTQALRAGEAARQFTERFLAGPFTVFTSLQTAPGASRATRYYAVVERAGQRLDAALVGAGLARVTSAVADFPTATQGRVRLAELRALEQRAAQTRRGVWAASQRTVRGSTWAASAPATTTARRVNLNTAPLPDVLALPGIGPKTAAAIVRARPIAGFEALDGVPGLGPKKIEALRDLVTF